MSNFEPSTIRHHSGRPYLTLRGTFFHPDTSEDVARAIERARLYDMRVRLWQGDTHTGCAWGESNDVCGRIGRSIGPVKAPLLIARRGSLGGPALLDHCIIAVQNTKTREWLYRHPTFDPGLFRLADGDPFTVVWHEPGVASAGEVFSRHNTAAAAARMAAFMRGERMSA